MSSASNNNNSTNGGTEKPLQLVPESVLKRKHDMDELKAKRQSLELTNPRGNRKVFSKSKNAKNVRVRKPETFIANARQRKHHTQRYKRVLKKGMQKRASTTKTIVTTERKEENDDEDDTVTASTYASNSVGSSFVFCVRIRDGIGAPRHVQKALQTLRLHTVHTGVFLRYGNDPSNVKLLHLVEPFVLYGVPTKATVADLIVRRGHAKVDGVYTPLSDNIIVEKALGEETGMLCLEDLVHELTSHNSSSTNNSSDHFQRAASFLAPFQLTAPKSKFQQKMLNDREDTKDYGDKGELMDDYIKRML